MGDVVSSIIVMCAAVILVFIMMLVFTFIMEPEFWDEVRAQRRNIIEVSNDPKATKYDRENALYKYKLAKKKRCEYVISPALYPFTLVKEWLKAGLAKSKIKSQINSDTKK